MSPEGSEDGDTPSGRAGSADESPGWAVVTDALSVLDLAVEPVEGFPQARVGVVRGEPGEWRFFVEVDEQVGGVLVYSVFPELVSEERRLAVAELVARANYLLRYGNLEMDFADGEVRIRTSVRSGPGVLGLAPVAELVRTNLEVANLVLPVVAEVALDGAEPEAAVAAMMARLEG